MKKNQIADIIYAVALVAAVAGAFSLLMYAIDMFMHIPNINKFETLYTDYFYQGTATVLLVVAILSLVGLTVVVLPLFLQKLRLPCAVLVLLFMVACNVCIFCLPKVTPMFDTTDYYVNMYDMQLHQSAVGMLLQQAVYFFLLGGIQLAAGIAVKIAAKKNVPAAGPQGQAEND